MQIPLANIMSGRVGVMADQALGGWVPLQRPAANATSRPILPEEAPLSLWMQMYILPDHENMLPSLQAQLEDSVQSTQVINAKAATLTGATRTAKVSATPRPRWGPTAPGSGTDKGPVDLIDLSNSDLLDVPTGVSQTKSDTRDEPAGEALLGLDADLLGEVGATSTGPGEEPSAFGFIGSGSGTSAFGFIASSNSAQSLDLAALYDCPTSVPAKSGLKPGGLAAPMANVFTTCNASASREAAAQGSLQSLEDSLLAGLSRSLRT